MMSFRCLTIKFEQVNAAGELLPGIYQLQQQQILDQSCKSKQWILLLKFVLNTFAQLLAFFIIVAIMCVAISLFYLNPNKAGLFEGNFFWGGGRGGVNLTPSAPALIFQEILIKYQYNFMQLLNNLLSLWKVKKCWYYL